MTSTAFIRSLQLFRHLPGMVVSRLASLTFHRTLRRREALYHEGEAPAGLHILQSGLVKIVRSTRQGRDLLLELVSPGEVVGACCGSMAGPHPCSAVALTQASVVWIRGPTWQALLAESPPLRQALADAMLGSRRRCVELAVSFVAQDVEARLASLLIRLRELSAGQPSIGILNQQEMAEAIGTAREVVTRHLSNLSERGVVRREGRRIVIVDPAALQRLADSG